MNAKRGVDDLCGRPSNNGFKQLKIAFRQASCSSLNSTFGVNAELGLGLSRLHCGCSISSLFFCLRAPLGLNFNSNGEISTLELFENWGKSSFGLANKGMLSNQLS